MNIIRQAFAAVVLLLIFSCAQKNLPGPDGFMPVSDVEPNRFGFISVLPGEGKFLDYRDGTFYTKKIFMAGSKWKKQKEFGVNEIYARVREKGESRLIGTGALDIYGFSFSRDKTFAAATARLGTSLNTTIFIFDMEKNEIIFSKDLERRPPGGPSSAIAMKKVWFEPKVSKSGNYAVCDSYEINGHRKAGVILLSGAEPLYTEFRPNSMLPVPVESTVYFLRTEGKDKKYYLWKAKISPEKTINNEDKEKLYEVKKRIVDMEPLGSDIFILTDENILIYRGKESRGIEEYFSLQKFKKEFNIFEPLKLHTLELEEKSYILFAVKIHNGKEYSWKYYAKRI